MTDYHHRHHRLVHQSLMRLSLTAAILVILIVPLEELLSDWVSGTKASLHLS